MADRELKRKHSMSYRESDKKYSIAYRRSNKKLRKADDASRAVQGAMDKRKCAEPEQKAVLGWRSMACFCTGFQQSKKII